MAKKQPEKIETKIKELKIEFLKNPLKRGSIKKEIARLLTIERQGKQDKKEKQDKVQTKLEGNVKK